MKVNHQKLVDYFEALATNLKDLNDFFRMDLTEIMGSFRSTAKFPCMVVESHEGDFADSNIMQSVNNITFAFTIYTKPKNADYNDQNLQLSNAEEIGIKILSRMRHDATTPTHILYNRFKVERVGYKKVGPVFQEQLYGYRFVGTMAIHESLIVNPEDWEDNPLICSS